LTTRVGVDAQGKTGGEPVGVLGLQAGYEWKRQTFGPSEWALKPAAELEGLYIGQQSPVGDMPITPSVLGTQYVTLPMTVGVVLANAVLTVQTPWSSKILPYLGVGAGVARVSIQGANSTNPSEPGINHFDSSPDASATAFAMQFKVGVKGEVARNLLLFAEYRHLSLNPTQYTFGETLPPHLPTDSWTVSLGGSPIICSLPAYSLSSERHDRRRLLVPPRLLGPGRQPHHQRLPQREPDDV
jgi:hypothetical protein